MFIQRVLLLPGGPMKSSGSILQASLKFTWDFLIALEHILTLGTLWLYLAQYWGQNEPLVIYGLVFVVYGLSRFCGNVLCDYLRRKNFSTKCTIVWIETIAVVGNILHFLAWHPAFVVIGKGLSGFVDCDTPFFSTINESRDKLELTRYPMISTTCRFLGWTIGALLLIPLSLWEFDPTTSWLNVSVYNFVGLLMAMLWLCHLIAILSLHELQETPSKVEKWSVIHEEESKSIICSYLYSCDSVTTYIILWTIFMLKFILVSLQVILPPVLFSLFQWREKDMAYFYILILFLAVAIYLISLGMRRALSDVTIAMTGMSMMFIAYVFWWVVHFGRLQSALSPPQVKMLLTFVCIFQCSGLPAASIGLEALLKRTLPVGKTISVLESFHAYINLAFLVAPAFGAFLWESRWIIFIFYSSLSGGTFLLFLCNRKILLANEKE